MQPEDIGIPRRGRRRVAGLRRHEVADAAAVSVTWYTWLEQGRDIHTTPQVIDALARALRLDEAGQRYLRRLAGVTPKVLPCRRPNIDEGLTALVDNLLPHPAQLLLPTADLVTWNQAYASVFVDPSEVEDEHRNGLWLQLMVPHLQQRMINWEDETALAIGRLRAEAAKFPGDPQFARVIEMLERESEFFRLTWARHEVGTSSPHVETVNHPDVGSIRARLVQLRPTEAPNLLLLVHILDDAESHWRVRRLLADRGLTLVEDSRYPVTP